MKLKLTLYNHLKMLLDLIVMTLLYFSFIFYFFNITDKTIIYLSIPYVVIFILPVIYIHLNYYIHDKNVIINIESLKMTLIKKDVLFNIHMENIYEIEFHMSANKIKNSGLRHLPFEDYYYGKIKLKDGNIIVITCLLSKKIDKIFKEHFKNIPITEIKSFYPLIHN